MVPPVRFDAVRASLLVHFFNAIAPSAGSRATGPGWSQAYARNLRKRLDKTGTGGGAAVVYHHYAREPLSGSCILGIKLERCR